MVKDVLMYCGLALLLYAPIPTALARLCNLGVISRLPAGKRVFLTFDDGPDPRYTPQVLRILGKAGVKACFFVVGEKARQYPGLINKILTEGHEIGSHGFSHRNPWLLGPVGTLREIENSFRAIKDIAGVSPNSFRPPWGLFTLSHLAASLLLGYKTVLWSFMSWDWSRGTTPEAIVKKVRRKITDGSILVFHDSDTEPGASAGSTGKMLSALPQILEEIKKRGYRIAPLKEINHTGKHFFRLLLIPWRAWDYLFRLTLGIKDVTAEDGSPTIFRISTCRYHGRAAVLNSGGVLCPGDRVCEIHLNNEFIKKLLGGETRAGAAGIRIAGELKRSLPALAGHISKDSRFAETGYIVAITLLHRGAAGIGFEKLEIASPALRRVISFYQGLILKLYHPAGRRRISGRGGLDPKILVMDKKTLLEKYLKAGAS